MDELLRRLISRRSLMTGAAALAAGACTSSSEDSQPAPPPGPADPNAGNEFNQQEIANAASGFFGSAAQGVAQVVEQVFSDLGRPNAYIAGEEFGAAVAVGVRYGEGWLYRRGGQPVRCYWTGPSIGFDLGANLSRCFTLVYNLEDVRDLFRRFPGVEGSYYFIAGIGVNYLRDEDITLAPMRTGLGARAGINAGYMNVTEERTWVPL